MRRSHSPANVAKTTVPGAIDLLEEAVHALRQASAGTLAWYFSATLPFLLGLLFFWADLSRDPGAADYSAVAALGLTALFVVMKTGQAIFAAQLRAGLVAGPPRPADGALAPPPAWTPRRVLRVALVQSVIQPSGIFVLPLAAALTVPLGWVCAFYGHASALADAAEGSPGRACSRAVREALVWPRQNHVALLVLALLGLFVWINVLVGCALLPHLLKMFSGEENAFTRAGWNLFNSTFFAVTGAFVYLLLHPLWTAFYARRAFHADARRTGEDLQRALGLLLPQPGAGGRPAAPHSPPGAVAAAAAAGRAGTVPS